MDGRNVMKKIMVVDESDEKQFEEQVNSLLNDGWEILSSSCGFADSEQYDFCSVYKAIMIYDPPIQFGVDGKERNRYVKEDFEFVVEDDYIKSCKHPEFKIFADICDSTAIRKSMGEINVWETNLYTYLYIPYKKEIRLIQNDKELESELKNSLYIYKILIKDKL